jgi:hypothetical protein
MFWLTSFIFLYVALYLFERDRMKLDWFQILAVALVPAILSALRAVVSLFLPVPPVLNGFLLLLAYPVVFVLLWKMMAVERNRAATYAFALFVFDAAVASFASHLIVI